MVDDRPSASPSRSLQQICEALDGAFTMADDTVCMETHITCVKFTKVCGGGGHGADSVISHNTCSKLIRVYSMVAVAMHSQWLIASAQTPPPAPPPVCTGPITTRGFCSRFMEVCHGVAFMLADNAIMHR